MKIVSSLSGVESISMDMKDRKLTVTRDVNAVVIVRKLKKISCTEIVSVGPTKELEKKKEVPKKEEKKEEPKKPEEKKTERKSEQRKGTETRSGWGRR